MAIWMQPMHTATNNLTQSQDPENYVQSIQSPISLASKPCVSGKHGAFAWAGAVLLREALCCFA